MRDVDEFLDQLTDAMSAVLAENERLRAGCPAGPAIGTADLDDANRQADEIIAAGPGRGRTHRRRRQGTGGDRRRRAAPVRSADRAAVAAFLASEREFLQSLAGLVQGHAESVKGMAKAARQAPAETAPAAATPSPATPAPAKAAQAAPTATPAAATPEPTTAAIEPTSPAAPGSDEPVRLEEPEPASVGRAETNEPAEGDSSLRELFWGED